MIASLAPAVLAALVLLCAVGGNALAQSSKPKVPPATDAGGIAMAMVGEGVDYTDPEIASRLARDGEGEIIGWDFVTGDNKPYASSAAPGGASTTAWAKLMLSAYARSRLVPVRVAASDAAGVVQAVRFLVHTPARIVAVPAWKAQAGDWPAVRAAIEAAGGLLFVLPGGDDVASTQPGAANLLIVAAASQADGFSQAARKTIDVWMLGRGASMLKARAATTPGTASEAVALAAAAAGCAQHGRPAATGAAARQAALALAKPAPEDGTRKLLDPLCLYGGQRF